MISRGKCPDMREAFMMSVKFKKDTKKGTQGLAGYNSCMEDNKSYTPSTETVCMYKLN